MAKTKTTTKKKAASATKKASNPSKNKASAKKSPAKKAAASKKASSKAKTKSTPKKVSAPKKAATSSKKETTKAKELVTPDFDFPSNTFVPSTDNTPVVSAVSDESRNAFRRLALGKAWKREGLIREAMDTFGKDNVEVKEFNNKQIAFYIGGVRVPSEGYFTVN